MVERLMLDGKRVTGLVVRQHGAAAHLQGDARGDPGGRRHRLARRSCSSPASARARCCSRSASRCSTSSTGVGENLQDHLQIRCAYKVAGVKTMNERFQSLVQRAGFAAQYALTRRGPMTMAPSQLGAFVKSDPSRETPNLQYHIQPLTLPKFGEPLDPFPAFTASVANIRPTSRGWVRITSPEPVGASRDPAQLSRHRRGPARGGASPCA